MLNFMGLAYSRGQRWSQMCSELSVGSWRTRSAGLGKAGTRPNVPTERWETREVMVQVAAASVRPQLRARLCRAGWESSDLCFAVVLRAWRG